MKITSLQDVSSHKVCKIGRNSFVISRIDLNKEFDYGALPNQKEKAGLENCPMVLAIRSREDDSWTIPRYAFTEIFLRAVMQNPDEWGISGVGRNVICRDYLKLASQNLGNPKRDAYRPLRLSSINEMTLDEYED